MLVPRIRRERRLQRARRKCVVAAFGLHDAKVVLRIVRRTGLRKRRERRVIFLLLRLHETQVHMCPGKVRLHIDRVTQRRFRLCVLAFEILAVPEVVVHLRIVRIIADGDLKLARRLRVSTHLVVGDAEAIVRRRIRRLDLERFLVLRNGLVKLSLPLEQMPVGKVRRRIDADVFAVLERGRARRDRLVGYGLFGRLTSREQREARRARREKLFHTAIMHVSIPHND